MNLTWLMGFTNFLLGTCLFPITLGVWWKGRYGLRAGRIAGLSALLCLGYFSHLVSLGLTAFGMVVLALAGPVPCESAGTWKFRIARLLRTSISFLPLFLLGYFYSRTMTRNGPLRPEWDHMAHPWSPSVWRVRLGWVDPITLAIKTGLPLTDKVGSAFVVCARCSGCWLVWRCGGTDEFQDARTRMPGLLPILRSSRKSPRTRHAVTNAEHGSR